MKTRTLILHPYEKDKRATHNAKNKLEEAIGLAHAIALEVADKLIAPLGKITPATYVGKGKVEEVKAKVRDKKVELVVVDCQLTPVQQRNLENAWKCKVIDRTALILEIFGDRAQTKEGVLQVELAALEYQKSRLVRSWTHLERQKGGYGFLGGPGETQIEIDRRMIRDRIALLKKQLEKVKRTRGMQRKSRQKIPYPVVALVGYTNAGKSTLFNQLTGAKVFVKDLLFATLDPTMRIVKLPSGNKIIVSDTVGFISDLPTELIAAFQATLEEVIEADIILHVRDISSPDNKSQQKEVLKILHSIGIDEKKTILMDVFNKIDISGHETTGTKTGNSIFISALTGEGCPNLLGNIDEVLSQGKHHIKLSINGSNSKLLAWLYQNGENVISEDRDGSIFVEATLSDKNLVYFEKIKDQ